MAFQLPHWQDFYEKAWAFRAKFLESQLESGANALQAIKELEKKERGYTLGVNDTTGEVLYMKKEIIDDLFIITKQGVDKDHYLSLNDSEKYLLISRFTNGKIVCELDTSLPF